MHIVKEGFHGDPNIGLFALATDKYVILPDDNMNTEVLNVPKIHVNVAHTNLCGLFLAGNSNGILVPSIMNKRELSILSKEMSNIDKNIKVSVINSDETVLGNLIICNDSVAIVSPLLKKYFSAIEKCLKVPVVERSFEDADVIGSLCICTNKGFLINMNANDEDFNFIKDALKIEGDIGTVNFGGQFVKSGIVCNSNGFMIGKLTTGPEVARIDEALGFFESIR